MASSAKVTLPWPKAPSDYALLVHLTWLTLPPLPRPREHLLPPSIVPRFLCRSSVACWAFSLTSTCGYTLMSDKAQDRERTWLSTKGAKSAGLSSFYNCHLPCLFEPQVIFHQPTSPFPLLTQNPGLLSTCWSYQHLALFLAGTSLLTFYLLLSQTTCITGSSSERTLGMTRISITYCVLSAHLPLSERK